MSPSPWHRPRTPTCVEGKQPAAASEMFCDRSSTKRVEADLHDCADNAATSDYNCTMEAKRIAALLALAAASAVGSTAVAHASNLYQFQSPLGNITCVMATLEGAAAEVSCEIADHTWVAPPRPQVCVGGWGDRFDLTAGSPAKLACHTDTTRGSGLPTLGYGDTRSLASVTCKSEPAGITCADSSTGHFIRISRESYQLG